MALSVLERPIALIVEDKVDTLATRKSLFTQHGFQAIGAQDYDEALREFRATPTIDVVVTDINLDATNEHDRSGVKLAYAIRAKRPQLPIIAYSGHVDALEPTDRIPFNDSVMKAELTVSKLTSKVIVWHRQALEYRELRAAGAKSELNRMRSEGSLVEPEVDVLRDFLPGHAEANREEVDSFNTPDEVLRREGWKFRLVDAGFSFAEGSINTVMPIPFWIKNEGGRVIAVLHGHSCIYNDGDTDDSAVSGALELMVGYSKELGAVSTNSLSSELEDLRRYLQKVFE